MAEMAGMALVALAGLGLGWVLGVLVGKAARAVLEAPWWAVVTALALVLVALWSGLAILRPLVGV